jgi:hypothetical protein
MNHFLPNRSDNEPIEGVRRIRESPYPGKKRPDRKPAGSKVMHKTGSSGITMPRAEHPKEYCSKKDV